MDDVFAINQSLKKIQSIEMFFCEYIQLSVIILSHYDLFGSEECAEFFVEIHLLLVTCRIVTDP